MKQHNLEEYCFRREQCAFISRIYDNSIEGLAFKVIDTQIHLFFVVVANSFPGIWWNIDAYGTYEERYKYHCHPYRRHNGLIEDDVPINSIFLDKNLITTPEKIFEVIEKVLCLV